jgi:hypothetical protein
MTADMDVDLTKDSYPAIKKDHKEAKKRPQEQHAELEGFWGKERAAKKKVVEQNAAKAGKEVAAEGKAARKEATALKRVFFCPNFDSCGKSYSGPSNCSVCPKKEGKVVKARKLTHND